MLDGEGRLLLYDQGNACYYRNRLHAGIEAGVQRLDAIEKDLSAMFDMAHKENHYLEFLTKWDLVEELCSQIRELPDFLIEAAVARIPTYLPRPTADERHKIIQFLIARKASLLDCITDRQDLFKGLPKRGTHVDHRYMLIRYVPDVERMEPINVGVILQGQGQLDVRLSPHAAKRKDVDTAAFRRWKDFFIEEVKGDPESLFQPEKTSLRFLQNIAELCDGPILLSRPLTLSTHSSPHSAMCSTIFSRGWYCHLSMSPQSKTSVRLDGSVKSLMSYTLNSAA